MLAASGDYVCCVDSDDYVETDMVAALYAKAVEEGADIVVADMYFEYSDQTVVSNFVVYQDREQNCKNVLDVKKNSPFLCSKNDTEEILVGHPCICSQRDPLL